ncbi:GDP-mannose-dependent alpha-mannosyltransferase [Devosia pacifica]|uniref:GDP-mannose-dependent alpha-mannosyltransferase n=1 Tax=Devosia pacifica TaxID=1335967 RepID=A0A918RW77_9HYPH|nr:glycosyltransferase family 1 protein [Devosia pacifica]GHA14944.1 GDP-mannose-dependent alpha-mannosyltransferase [Devosia pacifica]
MDRDGSYRTAAVPIAPRSAITRLLIVTDAWHPQTNGVVRSLSAMGRELRSRHFEVNYLTPSRFWTVPLPTYPEVRLSLTPPGAVAEQIAASGAEHIHIATEGPLGLQARGACLERGWSFTTSFHTRFAEYVSARVPVPTEWSWAYLRWFHAAASRTLVPTPSMMADLAGRGFTNLTLWSRGVDTEAFSPGEKSWFTGLAGPHMLYVGRVSTEKNIAAFLDLDIAGTKIVVGDGPQRAELEQRFPDVLFLGYRHGDELAAIYRSADVFVFPSRTDTFGNVMIEALASGVPVAAHPVIGPIDVITDPAAGVLDEDLKAAVVRALALSRTGARRHAEGFTWAESASQFSNALVDKVPMPKAQAV